VAVYNVNENLTPVLLSAMHTCVMSHLLVLVLVSTEVVLVSVLKELALALVVLQLILTTTLTKSQLFPHIEGDLFGVRNNEV